MFGQGFIAQGASFATIRSSLKGVNIPPICDGGHIYWPVKYIQTADPDPVTGTVVDPFGDNTTDLKMQATYAKPSVADTTSLNGKKSFQYPSSPATRIVMKGTIATYSNQFTFHMVYANAGAGNKAVFSFVSADKTKVIRFQSDSGVNSKAHLQTHSGIFNPLAAGNSLAAIVDTSLNFPVTVGVREIISIAYDYSVDDGTFYVYRNGALTDTIAHAGLFTLNGDYYLGADVLSGSSFSDFKGGIGFSSVYESLHNATEIAQMAAYLAKAF